MNKQIYLLGEKLTHTISPEIHKALGSYHYQIKELNKNDVVPFVKRKNFDGLNVTIPYKKLVATCVDEMSNCAVMTGSVNTIVNKNGKLFGDNTDYLGFVFLLDYNKIDVSGKKVYILGDGGAAVTIRAVMIDKGAEKIINFSHAEINDGVRGECDILVNCTPVGMFPKTQESPVDLNVLTVKYSVIDLIYNPIRTRLLLQAEKRKIIAVNGLSMLVAQAAHSAKYFGGKLPDDHNIAIILNQVYHQRINLVLTGFGGAGKTSIAKELHQITNRPIVDTDVEIEKITGRSVEDIIENDGEKKFRKIEAEVISGLAGKSGLIIATGGGTVLSDISAELLRQSGKVIFLRRAPQEKDFAKRPLYKDYETAIKTYVERLFAYENSADIILDIDHTKTVRESAMEIYDEIVGN